MFDIIINKDTRAMLSGIVLVMSNDSEFNNGKTTSFISKN